MRVALIGLGHAAADIHLPALAGMPGVTVVGGCDPEERHRARVGVTWRIPVFADLDALLDASRPDAVIVATPPASHAELCVRALAAGAHVVCEKPFVSSLEEADRVLAAAQAAGRQVAVNHEFRQMPVFRGLIDRLREPRAGPLRFVQAWQLTDIPPGGEAGWRGALVHRTLFEAGVHLVDLILAMFGERPSSVQATMAPAGDGEQGDALVLATLAFSGGRLAHLLQNRICKGERQYFEVRADTTRASFRASFGGRARLSAGLFRSPRPHVRCEYGASGLLWREDGPRRRTLARNPTHPNVVGTRALLAEAFEAFARNEAPSSSGLGARAVLEAVAGCYVSAETGQRVPLDSTMSARLRHFHMGAVQPGVPAP